MRPCCAAGRFGNLVLAAAHRGLPVAGLARRAAADPFPAGWCSVPTLTGSPPERDRSSMRWRSPRRLLRRASSRSAGSQQACRRRAAHALMPSVDAGCPGRPGWPHCAKSASHESNMMPPGALPAYAAILPRLAGALSAAPDPRHPTPGRQRKRRQGRGHDRDCRSIEPVWSLYSSPESPRVLPWPHRSAGHDLFRGMSYPLRLPSCIPATQAPDRNRPGAGP